MLSKIESLLEIESVRGVEKLLHLYRLEWSDMGPTSLETIEPLRTRYRELTGRVLQRIRNFYQEKQKDEQKNFEEKNALLERVQKISEENFDTPRQWQTMTVTIQNIFEDWKKIGYAPKTVNGKVWTDLQSALHLFYKKKREYFLNLKTLHKTNREKKIQLLEKVEAIANEVHEKWDEPAEAIRQLQKEWKEAGHIDRNEEDKLWKRFRESCDKFFEAKREGFKERDAEQEKNLKLKEELIERLNAFQPTGHAKEDLEKLREFSNEWKLIQHVPYKEKERIYEKYKKALDSKYESLKLDDSQRHLLKFKNNIDMLSQSSNSGGLIRKEQQQIKDRISKLNAVISQYENNLGFFSNTKNMGSLLKDVEENLNRSKEEMEVLKKKLKMLTEVDIAGIKVG
jgi:hypothetical protein